MSIETVDPEIKKFKEAIASLYIKIKERRLIIKRELKKKLEQEKWDAYSKKLESEIETSKRLRENRKQKRRKEVLIRRNSLSKSVRAGYLGELIFNNSRFEFNIGNYSDEHSQTIIDDWNIAYDDSLFDKVCNRVLFLCKGNWQTYEYKIRSIKLDCGYFLGEYSIAFQKCKKCGKQRHIDEFKRFSTKRNCNIYDNEVQCNTCLQKSIIKSSLKSQGFPVEDISDSLLTAKVLINKIKNNDKSTTQLRSRKQLYRAKQDTIRNSF